MNDTFRKSKLNISPDSSITEVGTQLRIDGLDGKARFLSPTASALVALADGSRSVDEIVDAALELFKESESIEKKEQLRDLLGEMVGAGVLHVGP